jgi:hypothetical protein
MNILKIKYLGDVWVGGVDSKNDLLILILEKMSGLKVELVLDKKNADLIIVYPYVVGSFNYKIKWLVIFLLRRFFDIRGRANVLRWLLGVGDKATIFVSHENLDRPYWWNLIGQFLIQSEIPRLTFWPKEIDPLGARFPYWYNYVDWPQYPRSNFYKRFGRLYKLSELMTSLPDSVDRKNRVISISSHLDHPRKSLLQYVKKYFDVDVYGASGIKFNGAKIDMMHQYKYAFCPENSTGYGYDTEKIPEAWVAGCIPVGVYLNPYSDFNPEIVGSTLENLGVDRSQALLLRQPDLTEIENYVRRIL